MIELTFETTDHSIKVAVKTGTNLTVAARKAGLSINTSCGGSGTCNNCKVILKSGIFHNHDSELKVVEPITVKSCQITVTVGPAVVAIPEKSILKFTGQIESRITLPNFTLRPIVEKQPSSINERTLAIAIDLGTTTVAATLIDLANGHFIDKASLYNSQLEIADNIASRISYASSDAGLEELQMLLIEKTVNPLIKQLCIKAELDSQQIEAVGVAGNTVMTHLFYGMSPTGIGQIPFTPVTNTPPRCKAHELKIEVNPEALIIALPSVSGYIGGDITGDCRITEINQHPGTVLMVDIGTNGEIVLKWKNQLIATSTPAGPAFEGAGLAHGMRGTAGAIERVKFSKTDGFKIKVIGDVPAIGICGSGIVDFIATAYKYGLITSTGRYDQDKLAEYDLLEVNKNTKGVVTVATKLTAGDKAITVSEHDISIVLQAKAAIFAGIKTLLDHHKLTWDSIDELILAGGFARHLQIEDAITIGLLPDIAREKIKVIGNGSLAGAALALLDRDIYQQMLRITKSIKVIELKLTEEFDDNFIDALFLPDYE